jgi:hypothetical protein
MNKQLTICVVESGYVVTVDATLFESAINDKRGMHAFNSIDKAIAFVRAQLIAKRNSRKIS